MKNKGRTGPAKKKKKFFTDYEAASDICLYDLSDGSGVVRMKLKMMLCVLMLLITNVCWRQPEALTRAPPPPTRGLPPDTFYASFFLYLYH